MTEQLVQSILEAENQAEQMRREGIARGRDSLIEAESRMKDAYDKKIADFQTQAKEIARVAGEETAEACRQAERQAAEQGEALRQKARENMPEAIRFIVERMR